MEQRISLKFIDASVGSRRSTARRLTSHRTEDVIRIGPNTARNTVRHTKDPQDSTVRSSDIVFETAVNHVHKQYSHSYSLIESHASPIGLMSKREVIAEPQ